MSNDSVICELSKQLQIHATGANAHTAGKAAFYLGKIENKPKAKFSNCTREAFIDAVREALYHSKWKELSDLMRRWW